MPLQIGTGKSDKAFVVGINDDGSVGAKLLPGQIATIVSADPATASFSQDSPSQPTDEALTDTEGTAVPVGTASVASGTVAGASVPAQPNVPINFTCTLTNAADGSPVVDDTGNPIPPLVDTVTVVPGLLKSLGYLFDTVGAPASGKK